MNPMKVCGKCGEGKSLDDFHKSRRDGTRSTCKPCARAYALENRPLPRKCACGCGESFRPSRKGVLYIQHHHGQGKPLSKSHRKKLSEAHQRRGRSKKQILQLKDVQFKPGEGPRRFTNEQRRKMVEAIRKKFLGKHGFGRTARDNPKHSRAKTWVLESPEGERYRISNLRSWCRNNEHLFEDLNPKAKTPVWLRAMSGLSNDLTWNKWRVLGRKGQGD